MPKRKAESKLTSLVPDDDDDTLANEVENAVDKNADAEPPAKRRRGRPKSVEAKVAAKPAVKTRSAAARPTRSAPKRGRKAVEDAPEAKETTEAYNGAEDEDELKGSSEPGSSADELDSPQTVAVPAEKPRRGRKPAAEKKTVRDGEFEYTPTGTKSGNVLAKEGADKNRRGGRTGPSRADTAAEEAAKVETRNPTSRASMLSPLKNHTPFTKQWTPLIASARRKSGAEEDTKGEVALRRRLGEMTKKYDNMESKYRSLREIGIVEANSNMDKLRKQAQETTAASKNLVAGLKEELAKQTKLVQGTKNLQTQLEKKDKRVAQLEDELEGMTTSLNKAQNEIKALQAKLTVSRNAAASAENARPGPGARNGASSRLVASGNAEAVQIAQLKEDLYSDLTGLIIRDVKKRESDHLYDCIQTGLNGTLHFKLAVAQADTRTTTTNLEAAEFHYMPLLDENRDRDLLDILPEYLTVDITFSRQHASRFYGRVMDTLARKRSD